LPGSTPYYGPYGPSAAPGPGATFQGNIVPPPSWDPYATPGAQAPALFPQNPVFPQTAASGPSGVSSVLKFRQALGVDYTFIPGNGGSELGINDVDLYVTFAFPFLYKRDTPLRVTPGFGIHYWNGPISLLPADPDYDHSADMPPQTFDAYLEAGWDPQINQVLGAELAFRIGVYSDFHKVDTDSLRYMGKGYLTLAFSPQLKIKGGIVYLDRVRVQLLPAGGIVWINRAVDPSVKLDILLLDPRLAILLPLMDNTDWWWYLRGEYGGGSWTIERTSGLNAGAFERVDYNDIRVATGLEFHALRGMMGHMEVGVTFERELFYDDPATYTFRPNTTVLVGGGLSF